MWAISVARSKAWLVQVPTTAQAVDQDSNVPYNVPNRLLTVAARHWSYEIPVVC